MKKNFLFALAAIIIASVALTSCEKDEAGNNVTSIEFAKQSADIAVETSEQLVLNITPSNADNKDQIVYTSSNESVMTVDQTGKITVKKKGYATITAKVGNLETSIVVNEHQIRPQYGRKMILIEQFTGDWCQYCPQGAADMQKTISEMRNPEMVCWIQHHANDKYTLTASTSLFNYFEVQRMPGCVIDRKEHNIPGGGYMFEFHPGAPTTDVLEDALYTSTLANISIEHKYNPETRVIDIKLRGVSPEIDKIRLSAMLVQSGIIGSQMSGGNDYEHKNMPRHMFTHWKGEAVTLDPTTRQFEKTIGYEIPEAFAGIDAVVENMDIIAYIAIDDLEKEDANILNAVRVPIIKK